MYSGYENWLGRGLDGLKMSALGLIYAAWRDGRPIDQQRAIFQLSRQGVDVDAAADALAALVNDEPAPPLLRVRDDRLTPTIAAAIHLRDHADAADDLAIIERVAAYLHQYYDPDVRAYAVADVAAALQLDERRLRQAIELWKGANDDRLGVEPHALFWTTYERFLARALGQRVPAHVAPVGPRDQRLPIRATARQVRWSGLGPFARATTLDLGAMTFVVGANAAGKTTALAALAALRDVAADGLTSLHRLDQRRRADADELVLAIDADLHRPNAGRDDVATIGWQLVAGAMGRLHARHETAMVGGDELAGFTRGVGRWRGPTGTQVEHTMRPDELALHTATDLTRLWPLVALRQQLAQWWIELEPATPDPRRDVGLHRRWLPYLEDPTALAPLRETARRVAGIRDLGVERHGVVIDDGYHRGPLATMPRGVVRVVELLAVLFAPDPPPLVAIDEIENHLHGDLALRLLEVMRSISHRTQIVVTTHSARVLRAAQPDEVQLCHRTPQGGAIAPLGAYPHLARLAASGDLGELIEGGHFVETP